MKLIFIGGQKDFIIIYKYNNKMSNLFEDDQTEQTDQTDQIDQNNLINQINSLKLKNELTVNEKKKLYELEEQLKSEISLIEDLIDDKKSKQILTKQVEKPKQSKQSKQVEKPKQSKQVEKTKQSKQSKQIEYDDYDDYDDTYDHYYN
jgi:hypothetical protein